MDPSCTQHMFSLSLLVLAATSGLAEDDSVMKVLRGAGSMLFPASVPWCGGEVTVTCEAEEARHSTLHALLHAASFPDVQVTNLTVGVSGWDAGAGHMVVVTAHTDESHVLHSGTPRAVGRDTVTVALSDPPPIREGRVRLTVSVMGGARLRTCAERMGTLDDGGLSVTVGACAAGGAAAVPCAPALLTVRYDAECAKPPKDYMLHDSLRVSRVGASDVRIMEDRIVPELRRMYNLDTNDDLIVERARFERWMGVVPHTGAMRLDYEVRSAEPRRALDDAALGALARHLAVAAVSRPSVTPLLRVAPFAAVAVILAALSAQKRRTVVAVRKGAVQVTSARGVYEKSLIL